MLEIIFIIILYKKWNLHQQWLKKKVIIIATILKWLCIHVPRMKTSCAKNIILVACYLTCFSTNNVYLEINSCIY